MKPLSIVCAMEWISPSHLAMYNMLMTASETWKNLELILYGLFPNTPAARSQFRTWLTFPSGTDSGVGFHGTALGISVHHELSIYVDYCGFSAIEALRSATSVGARRHNIDDRGRLMVCLIVDHVLGRCNLTEVILDTLNIERAWKRGVFTKGNRQEDHDESWICWIDCLLKSNRSHYAVTGNHSV